MNLAEKTPVLICTDDGRDVDDIEAITYLAGSNFAEISAVVTTHMIPDRRAMIARAVLNHLGLSDIPIGVGSIFPLGKHDETLIRYLREHRIGNKTYEGEGIIECFPDAVDVIHAAIDEHGSDLHVAVLAPMTDLARAAEQDADNFRRIGGLYIQGQAIVEGGRLVPDPAAYNLKEDMEAAHRVLAFQDDIPFTFVGKHAAYQLPLYREDFDEFANTGNQVGTYLRTHAVKGLECFAGRSPDIFERVFKVPATQLGSLRELSKPYDALVAKAIANPQGMAAEFVGHHALVGMSPERPGIDPEDAPAVKDDIMNTILHALRR